MSAEILKGPGRAFITYRDGEDEVRIPIAPTTTKDGKPGFDIFLKDGKLAHGQPVSLVLREKIRRVIKPLCPLEGELNVY